MITEDVIQEHDNLIFELADRFKVCPAIHKDDHIFRFLIENTSFTSTAKAIEYYFADGNNSAENFSMIVREISNLTAEQKILEFASGYGCVSRHLKKYLDCDIISCDIHEEAIEFIRKALGQKAILSHSVPENLNIHDNSFDVVFCLSFFSHVPESTWFRWLSKLYSVVNSQGTLVFTTHGYQSKRFFNNPVLSKEGYWFLASSEQKDIPTSEYGQTIVSPAYVFKHIKNLPFNPLVQFKEGLWWGHQDLWIVRKDCR